MQCKAIENKRILLFLKERDDNHKLWSTWFNGLENSISQAMTEGVPDKLRLAKMRTLIKRDLVGGCACGCRGDFEITKKGIEYINQIKQNYDNHKRNTRN